MEGDTLACTAINFHSLFIINKKSCIWKTLNLSTDANNRPHKYKKKIYIYCDKVVKLVCGGSVINGAYPV